MSSVLFSIEIPLKIIVTRIVKLPHSVQTTAEFEYLQQYCSPQSHTRTSCGDSFILCEWKKFWSLSLIASTTIYNSISGTKIDPALDQQQYPNISVKDLIDFMQLKPAYFSSIYTLQFGRSTPEAHIL